MNMKVVGEGEQEVKKKSIREQAQDELIEERTKQYVKEMKQKLKEIEGAKVVVSNLEREIKDLELKIQQETDAIRG